MERVFGAEFVACEAPIEVDPGDRTLSEPELDLIALKRSSDPFRLTTPPSSELAPASGSAGSLANAPHVGVTGVPRSESAMRYAPAPNPTIGAAPA